MRTKVSIFCGIVLVVCVLLLLCRAPEQSKTESPGAQAPLTNQPLFSQPKQPVKVAAAQNLVPPQPSSNMVADAIHRGSPEGVNEMHQRALTQWQAPIEFYGKTVDENSNAVAGVNIHFRWIEKPTEDGERTADTQSDSEGLFSLRGKRGASLTVWFSKEGYYSSHRGQKSFNYALGPDIISPDSLNPIILLLHKKGQGVELLTSQNGIRPNLAIRIPKDNTPVRVDFFQKQASSTGQLEISQNKPPWQGATNWSFSLSVPDGGLIENQDEFQFQAPDKGYQSMIEYHFSIGRSNWTTHVTKQFYITFGQPRQYGWLRFESDLAQETVFVTYVVNPSGSRNLEPP